MGQSLLNFEMTSSEKFCLKWGQFEDNFRTSVKKLRDGQKLCDVTLATDDGQHIQAHKLILSAGSDFFSDIFMKNNNSNMFIYLKGISSAELEPVIDFIYNGETLISHDELKSFIATSKELDVKGLEGKLMGIAKKEPEEPKINQVTDDFLPEYEWGNSSIDDSESSDLNEDVSMPVDKMSTQNLQLNLKSEELEIKIQEMIEKNEGVWTCKVCGKTAMHKGHIKEHVEIHIDGMSHPCPMCSKSYTRSTGLRHHITSTHSVNRNRKSKRQHESVPV